MIILSIGDLKAIRELVNLRSDQVYDNLLSPTPERRTIQLPSDQTSSPFSSSHPPLAIASVPSENVGSEDSPSSPRPSSTALSLALLHSNQKLVQLYVDYGAEISPGNRLQDSLDPALKLSLQPSLCSFSLCSLDSFSLIKALLLLKKSPHTGDGSTFC